jgi:hypothetical protein
MADNVTITVSGTLDETATSQTGQIAGNGKLVVDIKDINKTSVSVDYKDEDKLKISLQSLQPISLFADNSLVLSGGISYDALNKTLTGNAGLDITVSKNVAMEFKQDFNKTGNTISGKIEFKF